MFFGAVRISASEITLARLELLLVDLAPRVPLTQDFQRLIAPLPTSLPRELRPRVDAATPAPTGQGWPFGSTAPW
jgi:hypothetical protein